MFDDSGLTATNASIALLLLRCSCVYCIANSNRQDRSHVRPHVSWYEPQEIVFCPVCEASNRGRTNQPAASNNSAAMPPMGFFSVTPSHPPKRKSQPPQGPSRDLPPTGFFARPPLRDLGNDYQSSQDQSRVKRGRQA